MLVSDKEFRTEVQRILEPELAREGFTPFRIVRPDRLEASRGDVALAVEGGDRKLSWDRVEIQIGQGGESDERRWIAAWRLVPESAPARAYPTWRVRDPESLAGTLVRVRDTVLPALADYWRSPDLLAPLFDEMERELWRQYAADLDDQNLAWARHAYDRGDDAEAVRYYAQVIDIPEEDRVRRDLARQRLG